MIENEIQIDCFNIIAQELINHYGEQLEIKLRGFKTLNRYTFFNGDKLVCTLKLYERSTIIKCSDKEVQKKVLEELNKDPE